VKIIKNSILIGVFAFCLIFILIVNFSFSEEPSDGLNKWDNISFSTNAGSVKFFDHVTGKVYVYALGTGKNILTWKLDVLGKNLIRE